MAMTNETDGELMMVWDVTSRFTKESVSEWAGWGLYRKVRNTKAMRILGPFIVETREGVISCPDGYLALDSEGYPYPIAREEFEKIYVPVDEEFPRASTEALLV